MQTDALQAEATRTDGTSEARRCLACGYNLYGLGAEPRCPECGLLNIPEGYRKQVWELADAGHWFPSAVFAPFQKRLPGWWWALDRPNDVSRAVRFALIHIFASVTIILLACAVADSFVIEHTWTYSWPDAAGRVMHVRRTTSATGVLSNLRRHSLEDSTESLNAEYSPKPIWGQGSIQTLFEPSWKSLQLGVPIAAWAFWVWGSTAMIGLWTQIRKGLPQFARAPRTIVAASALEAHRMTYLAITIVCALGIETMLRVRTMTIGPRIPGLTAAAAALVIAGFGAAGWIGPIRSDYTRQLVRSRIHAVRIVAMYALAMPIAMAVITASPILLILSFILE